MDTHFSFLSYVDRPLFKCAYVYHQDDRANVPKVDGQLRGSEYQCLS